MIEEIGTVHAELNSNFLSEIKHENCRMKIFKALDILIITIIT